MPVPRTYSPVQIALHWVIAALIVVQLTVNTDMQKGFALRLSGATLPESAGAAFHAVVGITILVLAIVRVLIRSGRGVPPPHKDNHPLVNGLSHATHMLLYGFLFFMPITGALAWFTGVELAGVLHELGRLVLIPAILLHLGGALFEEIVLNQRVIRRMVRTKSP